MASTTRTNADDNNDGWVDVLTETQFTFSAFGDTFTGTFVGWSESEGKGIAQAHFENETGQYFINCGWSLKQQLKLIKKGAECRLIYVSDLDTGQPTPMMIFKVQTRGTSVK
jgi:hypothetical protein